jgi:hypothetical protein
MITPVKCYLPGRLIRNTVTRVFIVVNHIGFLFSESTKIPDSQKESGCSAEITLLVQIILGIGNYSYQFWG